MQIDDSSPVRLSEAILLGSVSYPQCRKAYVGRDGSGCLLTNAARALGMQIKRGTCSSEIIHFISDRFPFVSWFIPAPFCSPAFGETTGIVAIIILYDDDRFQWSAEQVAEWVAKLEAHYERLRDVEPDTVRAREETPASQQEVTV